MSEPYDGKVARVLNVLGTYTDAVLLSVLI